MQYHFLSKDNVSDKFKFQAVNNNASTSSFESYSLIFNSPLDIGNGRLNLGYYILTA